MFENLNLLADDPILGLMAVYANDNNPNKVDLGVGVYKNEQGQVSIIKAVQQAEREYLDEQTTKTYQGIAGDPEFNQAVEKLIYGNDHPVLKSDRVRTLQTPGSCGGLFLAANLIAHSRPQATLWVSNPTWGNHFTIFEGAGVDVKEYPYYDNGTEGLQFTAMVDHLEQQANEGDVVLLHGCCHNPTGADLSQQQWQQLSTLLLKKKLIPLIDQAYQGYSQSFEADAYGIAYLAEQQPEMLVSYSCSKNFSLYRERTGALSIIAANSKQADIALSQLKQLARASYSMPPSWGANLVKRVLQSESLTLQWREELDEMRVRISTMRTLLAEKLNQYGASFNADYLKTQHGMFSFLPLSTEQIERLREQKSVYIVGNGRMSFTGLTRDNIDYAARSIADCSK